MWHGHVLRDAARCGWSRFGAEKSSANEEISKLRRQLSLTTIPKVEHHRGLKRDYYEPRAASRFIAISTVDNSFTGYKQKQLRIISNGILTYLDPSFISFLWILYKHKSKFNIRNFFIFRFDVYFIKMSSRLALWRDEILEFLQSSKSNCRCGTILRRKEKDSRNSSLPRRTFLGRVVRRGGVSGCCRIDPIHHGGIYIPPLIPVLRCLPFSIPPAAPSRPHSRTARVVSPVRPLMPPLSWERLRGIPPFLFPLPRLPVFATTRIPLSQPPVLVAPLDDATAIVYASNLSTRKRNDSPPIAMRSGRLHDFPNFRSCTTESIYDGNVFEENLVFIGSERASNARRDAFVRYLRFLLGAFAFIQTRRISDEFYFFYKDIILCLF